MARGGMKMKKKGMARGGAMKKKGMARGGAKMPMAKDPKTGKMIPAYNPDAPWIDERINENQSGELLNEDMNEEDRQLSIPFK